MTTYLTPAEADALVTSLLMTADPERQAWEALGEPDKVILLTKAQRKLEGLRYRGRTAKPFQDTAFPRAGQMAVPADVKAALALEAAALAHFAGNADAQQRARLQAQGVKSFSIGKLSESYESAASGGVNDLLSADALALLSPYLLGGAPIA